MGEGIYWVRSIDDLGHYQTGSCGSYRILRRLRLPSAICKCCTLTIVLYSLHSFTELVA